MINCRAIFFLIALTLAFNVKAITGLCDINYVFPFRISITDFNSKRLFDEKIDCRFDTQAGNYTEFKKNPNRYGFILTSDPYRYSGVKFDILPIFVRPGIASIRIAAEKNSLSSVAVIAMIEPSVDRGSELYLNKKSATESFGGKVTTIYVNNQFELLNLYRDNVSTISILITDFAYKTYLNTPTLFEPKGDPQKIYFSNLSGSSKILEYKNFIKNLSCTYYFSNFNCE